MTNDLQKNYPNVQEFFKDHEGMLCHGGLLVSTTTPVGIRELVWVTVFVEDKQITQLEGETVYVNPLENGYQVGVELRGDWEAVLTEAVKALCSSPKDDGLRWGKDAESLFHAIARMSTDQKRQVALKGSQEERRILLKEAHHSVHSYLLKNPRIRAEEVAQIVRMPMATGDVINTVSKNTEWMQNHLVRLALIKNPKTPLNVVGKYIPRLNDQDLLRIAKSEHVRDQVSRLAVKTLVGRGKKVP